MRQPRVEVGQLPPCREHPHVVGERRLGEVRGVGPRPPTREQRFVLGDEGPVAGIHPVQVPPLAHELTHVAEAQVVGVEQLDVALEALVGQHQAGLVGHMGGRDPRARRDGGEPEPVEP